MIYDTKTGRFVGDQGYVSVDIPNLARLLHHEVVVDKVGGDFGAGEERSRKAG